MRMVCPYCLLNAELIDSAAVYGRSYGMIWLCQPCQAWVGVHKGSKDHKPLGTLAREELRKSRQLAHKELDPHWQVLMEQGHKKGVARQLIYAKLATEMGVDVKSCHIAQFDERSCSMVVSICARWRKAAAEAAADQLETRS